MYVIVNAKGEVETEIDSDYMPEVQAAVEMVYPQHTPIFTAEDMNVEHGRLDNPIATPEDAMRASGLPWRPHAKRPGDSPKRDPRGVGITMQEVLRAYPLDKTGLTRAWEDILEYFPNSPDQHGYKQWADSPAKMARMMLKSNAKTAKAVQGVLGMVQPSYAVGINLLPALDGPKMSNRDPKDAEREYYKNKGAADMPIQFDGRGARRDGRLWLPAGRRLPMVTTKVPLHEQEIRTLYGDPNRADVRDRMRADLGSGDRKMTTLCVGSSPECRATCLVQTGQNVAVAYNVFSKLFMTRAFFFKPLAFARMLLAAIDKHVAHCRKGVRFEKGAPAIRVAPYLRLNVYSDVCWELYFPELFDYCAKVYPDLKCYDYTKVPGRGPKPKQNYDLTFSFSGTNVDECKAALRSGQRVAVVFLRRTAKGSEKPDPNTGEVRHIPAEPLKDIQFLGFGKRKSTAGVWEGYPVIDGDLYDMRPEDPAHVVVGLRYKIPMKLDVKQRIELHDGRVLEGKIRGKTPSDLVSIKIAGTGKSLRIDPSEIKSIGDDFVLVPPTHTSKFLVNARHYKNQWIMAVTPNQTGADVAAEINSEHDVESEAG